jgi:hypothetical protein
LAALRNQQRDDLRLHAHTDNQANDVPSMKFNEFNQLS